eukprot:scaffold27251_cov55-Attheya_sp.AAC.2
MMDATQYSEPLLDSGRDSHAGLSSMMKRRDTSSDHDEYETGSHQGSFNLHAVISTAVTVEESSKDEVKYALQKILEDGIVTSTFYVGVLFSSMTLLTGVKAEFLFLSSANEIRLNVQRTWVSCLIFSVLWTLVLVIIMNTARVLILRNLNASRSVKNEVELKSITQFLNYQFVSGSLTGASATCVCIDLSMGFYWFALVTTVFPIVIIFRIRYINQHIIMKGGDDMLMQLEYL